MNNKPECATDYVVFDKHNHFITRGSVKDFIPLPIPAQIKSTFRIIFEKPFYSIGGFATQLWSIQLEEISSFEDEIHVLMADYMKRGIAVKIIRQHFEGQGFRVVFANNTGKFIACTNPRCGQFYYAARREPAVSYYIPCFDCSHLKRRQQNRYERKDNEKGYLKNPPVKGFEIILPDNTTKYIACDNPKIYIPDGKGGGEEKCGYYTILSEPKDGSLPQICDKDGKSIVNDALCLDCHMANGADPAKLLSLWPLLIDCAIGLGDITKRQGDVLVRQILRGMNPEEIANELGVKKRNIYKIIQEFNDNWINFQKKSENTSKRVRKQQCTYRGLAISIALKIRERQSDQNNNPLLF